MDAVVFTVVLFGLFSFFVFSVAAAVLYKTGEPITGVAGAAAALAPLCGPAAGYVFTIGWMGAVMTTSAGCAFFGLIPLLALESVLKPSHCVKNDDVIEWEHEET